uniref:NADH-ubiquinone oxidoreductase chain 4 n=1 Tax=Seira pallidipes TaxID=3053390 RepID=A0AAU6QDE4_9HEXA
MMNFIFFFLVSFFLFWNKKSYWFFLGVLILSLFMLSSQSTFLVYYKDLGNFSLDVYGVSLMILSLWISLLMYMSSTGVYKMYNSSSLLIFWFCVYFLCGVLLLTFMTSNYFFFYFFFEISLIPTLLIILGWGYQPERLQAGIYFLFYTLGASLPLLFMLMYTETNLGSFSMNFDFNLKFNSFNFLIFIFMYFAFLVKLPMFFTHLWLPKAHVEAPVAGSMILAGVLLKLGGYGIYRLLSLYNEGLIFYGCYFYGLSILGMVYVGFMCCRLNDLKALVAYSSVAHMGMVICGLVSFYMWGLSGSLMMMISHGLSSSGLFCAVNFYYERLGSRSFFLNKGLIKYLPIFSLFFFCLCVSNMAGPPTMNLMSEIFLMISMMKFDYLMLFFFPLGSFLGAVFTLILFSFSQHGSSYNFIYSYVNSEFREFHLFILHLLPLNLIFLKFNFVIWLI